MTVSKFTDDCVENITCLWPETSFRVTCDPSFTSRGQKTTPTVCVGTQTILCILCESWPAHICCVVIISGCFGTDWVSSSFWLYSRAALPAGWTRSRNSGKKNERNQTQARNMLNYSAANRAAETLTNCFYEFFKSSGCISCLRGATCSTPGFTGALM